MAGIIDPIPTDVKITPVSRDAESGKNVSSWYRTETLELNFGEDAGRPFADISLKREYLARFLETGWVIDAVLLTHNDGDWTTREEVNNSYTGSKIYKTKTETTTARWESYQKIRLRRRRIVGELVLQTMLDSFNNAYNSGRRIEDTRYNEIVSLYTLLLRRNEDEGNSVINTAFDVVPLLDDIKNKILGSLTKTDSSVSKAESKILESAIIEINRKFDALIAAERSRQISVGLYNSTIWPTTEAGFERQRQVALVQAESEADKSSSDLRNSYSQVAASVGAQLAQAAASIAKTNDERKISVIELRNNVMKWMLDYMGARRESFPELESQATIAQQVGFSANASTSNAL